MIVDPAVLPGLLLLAAELGVLAAVGFVVARVALRQTDERMALAQGLVIGPALWGLITNLVLYAVPGMAGAAVGWGVTLAIGAGFAWRASHPIRPTLREVGVFVVAALVVFWIALASRQLLGMRAEIHLGLAASIRAGGFPPELPWNPGMPALYHYGSNQLIGLLAPPVGPDLAFVTELLDSFAWTSFALVVVTALMQRASGFAVLVTAPLLLTAGALTLVLAPPPHVLQIPIPAGVPTAGLRASLTDIYAPFIQLPLSDGARVGLANIWNPAYTLAYALLFVVLERAARAVCRSWLANLTLAALVGFVGLLSTTLGPILLVMWAGLDAARLLRAWHAGSADRGSLLRSGAGLALGAVLVGVGGGILPRFLDEAGPSVFSFGWIDDPGSRRLLASFDAWPGGIGVLGVGPVVVAGVAVLLAWRDRLALTLVAGVAVLLLARLILRYEPFPADTARLDGHARNLALLALLLAVGARLSGLRQTRWRYAAGAVLAVLVTWPTVAEPVRNLGLAIGQRVEFANARSVLREGGEGVRGRYRLSLYVCDEIATYIRGHTAVDARVLSPHPAEISAVTGRSNASGFAQHQHLLSKEGPSYRDAIQYLEPAALRRLGIAYVHAPDAWVGDLPDRAARWLADARYFDPLVREGAEALYRVRPEFLRLDAAFEPASYEALRRAIPPSTTVYLAPTIEQMGSLRAASALSHARLLGVVDEGPVHPELQYSTVTLYARRPGQMNPGPLHLLTPWPVESLGDRVPDIVVASAQFVPWMFPPAGRQPIWWNDEVAVYAPNSAVAPIMAAPPELESFPVGVRVSDARTQDGRLTFTARFDDRAPGQWSGQDWVVAAGDASPWALPVDFQPDGRTPEEVAWFAGHIGPGMGTTTRKFEFDGPASRLAVRDSNGVFTEAAAAGNVQGPGSWMLAVRLRHERQPEIWRLVAIIPVLQIEVSEAGEVSYRVYQDPLSVSPRS